MKTLRLVLGDQLSRDLPSLTDLDPDTDLVLMAEVMSEVTYVKHHKRKIAYLFSAMRHFAEALGKDGIAVRYRRLDDADNAGSLAGEVAAAIAAWAAGLARRLAGRPVEDGLDARVPQRGVGVSGSGVGERGHAGGRETPGGAAVDHFWWSLHAIVPPGL